MPLYFRGRPLRRIEQVFADSRTRDPHYLIETWEPRRTCICRADQIGSDGGIDEVIRTAKLRGGQILDRPREEEGEPIAPFLFDVAQGS